MVWAPSLSSITSSWFICTVLRVTASALVPRKGCCTAGTPVGSHGSPRRPGPLPGLLLCLFEEKEEGPAFAVQALYRRVGAGAPESSLHPEGRSRHCLCSHTGAHRAETTRFHTYREGCWAPVHGSGRRVGALQVGDSRALSRGAGGTHALPPLTPHPSPALNAAGRTLEGRPGPPDKRRESDATAPTR